MSEHNPYVKLTREQVQFFRDNGFLALDSITSQKEVESLHGIYDDLFARRAGREDGNQFDLTGTDEEDVAASVPQILSPSRYAPALRETQLVANARSVVRQLIGDDARELGDHAILKPPHSPQPTPWHQDEAYWDPTMNYNSVSVWVPLQRVTIDTGCMWFVPGSHKLEVLKHRSVGNNLRITALELDEPFDTSNAIACPLPAGGATIHLSRTLHYTGANNSDVPRRAYIIVFGTDPVPRGDDRRFIWNELKHPAREARAQAAGNAGAVAVVE